jgi:hypothetical protein
VPPTNLLSYLEPLHCVQPSLFQTLRARGRPDMNPTHFQFPNLCHKPYLKPHFWISNPTSHQPTFSLIWNLSMVSSLALFQTCEAAR